MTTSPNLAVDFLIAAAQEVHALHEWSDELLGDAGVFDDPKLAPGQDALAEAIGDLGHALREFTNFSDGRPIQASVEIEPERGHFFSYIFKPIPEHRGERMLFETHRPADPDEGDRGTYRVFVDDRAATIRVELLDPKTGPGRHLGVVR